MNETITAELGEIRRLLGTDRREALRRAAALAGDHPDRRDAAMLLAAAHSLLQDYAGAQGILTGLWARDADPDTAFNLGYCSRQLGDYRRALSHFLAALALRETPSARALAADTAAILGEVPLARRLLDGRADPVLAFRARLLARGPAARSAAALRPRGVARPEEIDAPVLFWMKYDCHLYARLDDKRSLAGILPADAPYWPQTFAVPENLEHWRAAAREDGGRWLYKPSEESGGRGMVLLAGPEDPVPDAPGVVQRLVDPPFLHEGRKLNLRLLLGLPRPSPAAALLWRSALVYASTTQYETAARAGPADAGAIANLLRADAADLGRPLGALPAHAVTLETLVSAVPPLGPLPQRLADLARALVADLEAAFLPAVRAVGENFPPRFLGLDVGLDADARPFLFEIERYPGLGGVSPVTAAINGAFRRDWAGLVEGDPAAAARFIPLC